MRPALLLQSPPIVQHYYRGQNDYRHMHDGLRTNYWVRKKGSFGKGVFSEKSISRDSREFRDSRDFREPPDCGKQRRIRPFSRDSGESRDFRDSRDSSSEKTPFVMTPFSGPEITSLCSTSVTLEFLVGIVLYVIWVPQLHQQ